MAHSSGAETILLRRRKALGLDCGLFGSHMLSVTVPTSSSSEDD